MENLSGEVLFLQKGVQAGGKTGLHQTLYC
jgi:hypothetical protein